jgi:hypothetical protein
MRDAILIIAAVMLGTIAVTWTAGRLIKRARDLLTAMGAVTVRACLVVLFALLAVGAARRGGYAWIEASIFGLFTLWSVAALTAMIWVWVREGLSDGAEAEG